MVVSKLVEIDQDSIPCALEVLKQDWPRSIHIYYFIWMQLEWRKMNLSSDIRVFCCNGNPDEGVFVAISIAKGEKLFAYRVMVYARKDDKDRLGTLLFESNIIDWSSNPIFEAVSEEYIPSVKELCAQNGGKCYSEGIFYQFWLPPEKHIKISVECPEDTYLGKLREEDVEVVNENWKYGTWETKEVVLRTIQANPTVALFKKENGKLVSWTSMQHFGGLGMLFTDEKERSKGYAKIVTAALSKALIERNVNPYATVRDNNLPSISVFKKLGFEIADRVTWMGGYK